MNCPDCGGECWDETKGKYWGDGKNDKTGKAKPPWKCKNKESCGWKGWSNARATDAQTQLPRPSPKPSVGPPVDDTPPPDDRDAPEAPRAPTGQLEALFAPHEKCFDQAMRLAGTAEAQRGVNQTLEGTSALCAQLFIAAQERGIL